MSETPFKAQEFDKQSVAIQQAVPEDAEIICDIRDRAWIKAYPNPELGITAEDIKVNAQGQNGEFVPRELAASESLQSTDGQNSCCADHRFEFSSVASLCTLMAQRIA